MTKKIVKRTGAKPGWHHVGVDIPNELYARLQAEARANGVPYTVIQRWALESYLAPVPEGQPK